MCPPNTRIRQRTPINHPGEIAMTNPIVVGVDGSGRSLRALEWAAHSADLHHCPLRIVQIPELEITSAFPSGTAPAKALMQEAEHAQTLVLGAKGIGLGNLALGSVSMQVVGHAASPVVIVNHVVAGNRRVAVGTDLSPYSTAALDYAFQEASLRQAQLQIIHCLNIPYPPKPPLLDEPNKQEIAAKHQHALEEQIGELRKRYPEVEVVTRLPSFIGPVLALARASDRADLLVVGSRGNGGFHGLAVGSVSHHLLHTSACPLAIVRHTGNADIGLTT
jgi:nucleotide-binding universal stress UspA family protein